MAEIVNLRRVRKRLAREKDAQSAAENRVLHGRTKGERLRMDFEATRQTRDLDNARMKPDLNKESRDDGPLDDATMKSEPGIGDDP
ncbi:DUF4169 family protein [Asaia astilbis]|uniref:DUF4169 family protein n=1 Tax=Asaia astilbis TaxID=610244 RepID=UPI000471B154|nr:DUF4169 family protein [Asaia astilbis]